MSLKNTSGALLRWPPDKPCRTHRCRYRCTYRLPVTRAGQQSRSALGKASCRHVIMATLILHFTLILCPQVTDPSKWQLATLKRKTRPSQFNPSLPELSTHKQRGALYAVPTVALWPPPLSRCSKWTLYRPQSNACTVQTEYMRIEANLVSALGFP